MSIIPELRPKVLISWKRKVEMWHISIVLFRVRSENIVSSRSCVMNNVCFLEGEKRKQKCSLEFPGCYATERGRNNHPNEPPAPCPWGGCSPSSSLSQITLPAVVTLIRLPASKAGWETFGNWAFCSTGRQVLLVVAFLNIGKLEQKCYCLQTAQVLQVKKQFFCLEHNRFCAETSLSNVPQH